MLVLRPSAWEAYPLAVVICPSACAFKPCIGSPASSVVVLFPSTWEFVRHPVVPSEEHFLSNILSSSDDFILGVTSATPSLVGNSAALTWQGKYVRDEWGSKQYHEVTIPAEKDKQGNVFIPELTETQVQLNPDWNTEQPYVSRLDRPEWVAVGLVGQVPIRDDGTCETHGYCRPNDDGIATKAERGYFVLKLTLQIRFWF